MFRSLSLRKLLAFALLMLNASFANGAEPVKLTVYFESFCTDCKAFYTKQMYPVWSELKGIMTMDTYWYGNALETPTEVGYDFKCQHGPAECKGNMMMMCAKDIWPEDKYLFFGDCIMEAFVSVDAGEICADAIEEDYEPVKECWTSTRGQQLLHEVGVKQSKLDPGLTYVPWIIINDVFPKEILDEAQKDLRKVICDAYEGVKPDECNV